MKALFPKFLLLSLFVLISSNVFSEDKSANNNTSIDVQISGLAGIYTFQYPEYKVVKHTGSGTTTVTLSGMVGILDEGIPVHVSIKRNNSSATKINVYSPNYRVLENLNADGTKVLDFTVPYTGSNDVYMALQ